MIGHGVHMTHDTDELLLIDEVAQLTKLPPATIRYYRALPHKAPEGFPLGTRVGGRRVVWRRSDVEAFIAQRFDAPPAA